MTNPGTRLIHLNFRKLHGFVFYFLAGKEARKNGPAAFNLASVLYKNMDEAEHKLLDDSIPEESEKQ